MPATIEKVCESNGVIVYRVTMKLANGSTKVENFARLFDAQKRVRQFEDESKKGAIGNHYT
ncbi:MAG: hypothetical protein WCJ11_02755 [Methylococcaceae bacterium]